MTGEQIVGISTEQLEAMSDDQMLEFFKDVLPITRPPTTQANGNSKTANGGTQRAAKTTSTRNVSDMLADLMQLAMNNVKQGLVTPTDNTKPTT